jgi:hypothetical protein
MAKIGGFFMCKKRENQTLIAKEEFVGIINRFCQGAYIIEQWNRGMVC